MRIVKTFFENIKRKLDDSVDMHKRVLNVGQIKFPMDIFNREVMEPHTVMTKSIFHYQKDPNIQTGVDQLSLFIKPETISIKSKDKTTAEWWKGWLDKRPKFDNDVDIFIIISLATGNGYFEVIFDDQNNPNNYATITDPSRIYYNLEGYDVFNDNQYWIYQLPEVQMTYLGLKAQRWRISYVRGSKYLHTTVYGVAVPKEKIVHFKLGWSLDNFYGRGIFSSGLDSLDVVREIIKSYAIRSRYKSIGKKIWMLGNKDMPAGPQDVEDFELQTQFLEDEGDMVINKPLEKIDVSYSSDSDSMNTELEYLRKSSTSSTVPNFITPFAEEVNRATSEEAKIPFELRLNRLKRKFIKFLNDNIIKPIQETKPFLKDATFDFGTIDLTTKSDKMDAAVQLYQLNAMTYNELRKAFNLEPLPKGEVFMKDIERTPEQIEQSKEVLPEGEQVGSSKMGIGMEKEVRNMKTELGDDENKNIMESTETFKSVIEDAKEELRNWQVRIDESDNVAKFSKMYGNMYYTFYVSEKTDGMYILQLYKKNDRIAKVLTEKDEVINNIAKMWLKADKQ